MTGYSDMDEYSFIFEHSFIYIHIYYVHNIHIPIHKVKIYDDNDILNTTDAEEQKLNTYKSIVEKM